MKKPVKQRGKGSSTYIVFGSDEPWDTLKAQLLAKILALLNPYMLVFEDYKISFTVPRHSKTPLPLHSSEDFKQLLQQALKMKKDPTTNIMVEALAKKNNRVCECCFWDIKYIDHACRVQGKKKIRLMMVRKLTKVTMKVVEKQRRQKYVFGMISHLFVSPTVGFMQKRIDPAMLPGNKALTARIAELCNRWWCNDKTCHTGSDYCYVSGSMVEHYALSHAHLDVWAAALVSHHIFLPIDGVSVDQSQLKPDTTQPWTVF
jgi:hypothetical protein